jgi:predicted metal-dependent peptidase
VQTCTIAVYTDNMWKATTTDFNIEKHLIVFLQESPFYAEISRHIRKTASEDLPTAAVTYDPKMDEIGLWYNPSFFEKLSNWEIKGVLTHEFNHLVFGHLAVRRKKPNKIWNIATDLAINSLIVSGVTHRREGDRDGTGPLPEMALIPGKRPVINLENATPEQKAAANELADLIASFPVDQPSEWYFDKLMEAAKGSSGLGEPDLGDILDSLDDHGGWDNVPEELREMLENKIKSIVEKAVNHADSQPNGWGNMPAHLQQEIRRSVSNVVNWRSVLRQFVGTLTRAERSTSIKRINKRYPYIHPGVKRGYTARLCIAIDQSGSVDDTQLQNFFSELGTLTKRVTVDILPFDCSAEEKDIFEWRKGTTPVLKRVRGGGTDFNAPTTLINDAKNRGRWDGFLIMTDGMCSAPGPSRIKRGWVLSKGNKLEFSSSELQVFLDDSKPMTGAWR